jgi:quinoprotein glucose dehydrogenase
MKRPSKWKLPFALFAALLVFAGVISWGFAAAGQQNGNVNWADFGGGPGDPLYSPLDQINRGNVSQLQVAWTYATGDGGYNFNPLVVDGVMYTAAKNHSLVALDAATGKELWVHPDIISAGHFHGINYWQSKDGSDRRLIFPYNSHLTEINAKTGDNVTTFGDNGSVDLRLFHGTRAANTIVRIQSPAAGRVFENIIIVSEASGEEYGSPPGDVRAYDILTGKMLWLFHIIPQPGEPGADTWDPEQLKNATGGGAWGELTLDEKRGIIYVPTGAAVYNFYGANRKGKNLYGDCILALNARTGKLIWYYQMIHHDIWDDDSPAGAKLLTITHDGKKEDVLVEATKTGLVFVFDRDSGKLVFPVDEKPVPKSEMVGEQAWPTQPIPSTIPPFGRQTFTDKDIDPYLAQDERDALATRLHNDVNEGVYTPPELGESVQMPGNHGGANWGMVSMDPSNQSLIVATLNVPAFLKLEPAPVSFGGGRGRGATLTPLQQGKSLFSQNCQICHGDDLKGQPPVVPALLGVTNQLNDDQIKTLVRSGLGQMPSFSSLTDADLNGLIAYLKDPSNPAAGGAPAFGGGQTPLPPPAGETRYWSGFGYSTPTRENLPIINPPWSTLTDYDMNKGTIRWQIPLGEDPELAAKGITNTGAPNIGVVAGIVTTGGGLIFSSGTTDRILRAIDEQTGKELWRAQLPAQSQAIPTVYEVHGREYLAIPATAGGGFGGGGGGRGNSLAPAQPAYVVYALPESSSVSH